MKNFNRPQCVNCHKHVSPESHYCNFCGTKIEREKKLLSLIDEKYQNTYGTWRVTTEGDVEGRSTRQLGTFEGHLDEIAKVLADKACYSLNFKSVAPVIQLPKPKRELEKVSVQFDIDSKTWDMGMEKRAEIMASVLKDRPVTVKKGQYYASFVIKF